MGTQVDTEAGADVLIFARRGNVERLELENAARQKMQEANAAGKTLEQELRRRLVGRTIVLSGYTETVERMIQDGYEHCSKTEWLERERVVVKGLFLTRTHRGNTTLIVYADREEAALKMQRGGGLSFDLLGIRTRFEFAD